MSREEHQNSLSYVDKALTAFNEIMASSRKDMMENLNRAHKGELFVLHYLMVCNREVLPSELSVALQASTARISALLGALEKKGQIVRDIDKSNRRNILVTITEEGRNRAEAEMKDMKNRMVWIFTDMGEADTIEFIRLTRLFSELMQKYSPQEEGCTQSD